MMSQNEYIILDAARMDGLIFRAKELNERHSCLYEGDSEKFMGTLAPWMFQLERDTQFAEWLLSEASARNWGMVIIRAKDGKALYEHLRKFLIINTQEEKELYFRYYEPSVLQALLPTCDIEQLIEFFGPVDSFIMKDDTGEMLAFDLNQGRLHRQNLQRDLKSFFKSERSTSEEDARDLIQPSSQQIEEETQNEKWDFGF